MKRIQAILAKLLELAGADVVTKDEYRAKHCPEIASLGAMCERLTLACNLHVQEIKRLEAVRDALTEELAQERADRLIKTENAKLRRSEGSKRGWVKRRAA
jgi:hypothetical protein